MKRLMLDGPEIAGTLGDFGRPVSLEDWGQFQSDVSIWPLLETYKTKDKYEFIKRLALQKYVGTKGTLRCIKVIIDFSFGSAVCCWFFGL
jgi:hypothetical protein